jgi:hypothetical protein
MAQPLLDTAVGSQGTVLSLGERVASVASQVRGYVVVLDLRPLLAVGVTPHPARAGWRKRRSRFTLSPWERVKT